MNTWNPTSANNIETFSMEKSVRSTASDSEEGWESESELSYDEDDTDHEDDDLEDRTIESQRLIAIGILQDDEGKPQGLSHGLQNEEEQEGGKPPPPSTYSDEAVANSIAKEEHNTKMRIKEERESLGKPRPKRSDTSSSTITRSDRERHEKMRTFEARRGVPRSRPLRDARTTQNASEEKKLGIAKGNDSKRSLDSCDEGTIESSTSQSASSGIDLDEKTRQRILSRSALRYARPKRSSLQNNQTAEGSASIRPSDEKRNLRISPRMPSNSNATQQLGKASNPSTDRNSRPSDEKAAFRRRNNRPRRARAIEKSQATNASEEENIYVIGNNDPDLSEAREEFINGNIEENNDIENANFELAGDLEESQVLEDEEPEILPGAFAVSGIGDEEDGQGISGYDSGFENDVDSLLGAEDAIELMEESQTPLNDDLETAGTGNTMMETTSTVISTPLTAELYEAEQAVTAVSAKVLNGEGDDPDTPGKMRRLIAGVFLGIILVTGTVMAIVLTRGGRESTDTTDQDSNVPMLVGWEQVGETLTVEAPYKDDIRFGNAVAISADGNRIAVGLPGLDDSEEGILKRAGSVQIFDLNGTNWEPQAEILGAYSNAELGTNVALSDDGKRVAIGAPSYNSDESGYVVIYEESNATGQWVMAVNFSGGIEAGSFGDAVGFAGDGTVIAIGDKISDDRGLEDAGVVRIYQEVNGIWSPMGNALVGSKRSKLFGWSVSLSQDGSRVAASSLKGGEPGNVHIFDFNGTVWETAGSSLIGESTRENFGFSVKLSGDGDVLAIGAPDYSRKTQGEDDMEEDGVGIVRSYRYDGEWTAYGQPLEGENRQDAFGSSVSLSKDGSTIAIGGPENGNFCNSCGQVKIFQSSTTTSSNKENAWESVGSSLGKRDIDNGQFGYAVALSENGKRVVGASPFTKFDGSISRIGQVVVFDSIIEEDTE